MYILIIQLVDICSDKGCNLIQPQPFVYIVTLHLSLTTVYLFFAEILSELAPKTINMFHFTGTKRTTPKCPLNVIPNFNPKTGSQSFSSSGSECRTPCEYRLPFFMDNFGPKYNAFSVAGHEGRPGHHTQVTNLNTSQINRHLIFTGL